MACSDLQFLTSDELTTLRTNTLAGLNAVLSGGQSYSAMGRSFTLANVAQLRELIADITGAIALKAGTMQRTVISDFSQG